MRIIIQAKEDNSLFTTDHIYRFKELGDDENLNNWVRIFQEILLNLGYLPDQVYSVIPDNIQVDIQDDNHESIHEGLQMSGGGEILGGWKRK